MGETLVTDHVTGARRRFFLRAAAFCAMLGAAMVFRAQRLSDWDSWDYAAQAIQRHSSDLLLGRWWFIAAMRAAYLFGRTVFGLDPLDGYLAMQAACAFFMAAAVVAGMVWTYRLTRSETAEMVFAILMILGPMIGIYASAVMTEGATLLTLMLACLAWERAMRTPKRAILWALAGGLLFGVVVDMREQAISLCALPVVLCFVDRPNGRWKLLATAAAGAAVTLGIGVLCAWAWYPWTFAGATRTVAWRTVDFSYFWNMVRWTGWMSEERKLFTLSIPGNLKFLAMYCAAVAPAAALLTLPGFVWAYLRRRRLFWVAVSITPYLLTLAINHDLSVNPRFAIPAVWMLAPVAAAAVAAWVVRRGRYRRRLTAAIAAIVLLSAAAIGAGWRELDMRHFQCVESLDRTYHSMLELPYDAVVVAGPGTPVACYLNRLKVKHFKTVGSGWGWPGDELASVVDGHVNAGRMVYVNLRESDWYSPRDSGEWETLQQVVSDYDLRPAREPMVRLVKRPKR